MTERIVISVLSRNGIKKIVSPAFVAYSEPSVVKSILILLDDSLWGGFTTSTGLGDVIDTDFVTLPTIRDLIPFILFGPIMIILAFASTAALTIHLSG